jgi:hypothetical protein
MLTGSSRPGTVSEDGIPVFHPAGAEVVGRFVCAECGYGVAVRRALPTCPMCGGVAWEPIGSSPFAGTVSTGR